MLTYNIITVTDTEFVANVKRNHTVLLEILSKTDLPRYNMQHTHDLIGLSEYLLENKQVTEGEVIFFPGQPAYCTVLKPNRN